MKTPPLLIGAALIFWGWQTGLWIFAIPMAVIIEGSRLISWRWEFTTVDVRRVANLCLIILIVLLIYLLIQNPTFYFVYTLLQWLPVVLFPLLIVQTYEENGTTWNLGTQRAKSSKITISTNLRGGQGLLTLPDGTFKIDELVVNRLEKNKFGAVKVAGKVNDIDYQAYFNHELSLDNPPTAEDLEIPNQEKAALNQILSQLNVEGKSPQEIVNSVDRFFLKNFTYSLQLTGQNNYATPISTFLLKNRAGHCEYFATATTLLLRAAGIPARYAVGYSVHEFSNLENQYIVRSRHAHAWTMVYLNNRWQVLDTTPADWTNIEDAAADKLSLITDWWSLLSFRISRFLRSSNELKYVWWLIFPLVFILIWRGGQKKGARRLSRKNILLKPTVNSELAKKNSEFDLIEKALNELGLNRYPSESWKNWINRLKKDSLGGDLVDDMIPIIELYYRDRFDPAGIKESEKTILKSAIEAWLDKYHQAYSR